MRLPSPRPHQRACTATRLRAGARAWQVVWLACLLLALAWVPTLGRVHQALHSGDHRAVPIHGLAHAGHAADSAHPHAIAQAAPAAAALIESLLPAHNSGLDCLLLDQLALTDGLLASAPGLPAVPSIHHAPVGLVQHGWVLHRALFQARAPPAALRA